MWRTQARLGSNSIGYRNVLRNPVVPIRKQQGVVAMMFAIVLIAMIGFMGLALDLSRLYNRKVELQSVADVAALAAARQLVGTTEGIDRATAAAAAAVGRLKFNYNSTPIAWSASAITFSTSSSAGAWVDASAARASAGTMRFVRVDTSEMDPDMGVIDTIFMRVVSSTLATASTSASAIAGRSSIDVTPLALCAMSADAATSRPPKGELVQYGFRRGVAYDLMQLNPGGTQPINYVVNPIDPGTAAGSSTNTTPAIVGPFVCSGTIPVASVIGSQILVSSPFPIGSLFEHLNSRFDQYNGGHCNYQSAPPDFNVRQFTFNSGVNWMKSALPTRQTANPTTAGGILRTMADLGEEAAFTAPLYGPMWSFAKPVPFSEYTPGSPEPEAGYTAFNKSEWAALYTPGAPEPKSAYPAATPYAASGGPNFMAPVAAHGKGLPFRRVLNVPLLECPVGTGANATARVVAIGRFFMTVPATATSISAEFAGLATGAQLGGAVELYR